MTDLEIIAAGIAQTTDKVNPAPGILLALEECEKTDAGGVLVVAGEETMRTAATMTQTQGNLGTRWNGNWTCLPACWQKRGHVIINWIGNN